VTQKRRLWVVTERSVSLIRPAASVMYCCTAGPAKSPPHRPARAFAVQHSSQGRRKCTPV
jgi:hypothetical protein